MTIASKDQETTVSAKEADKRKKRRKGDRSVQKRRDRSWSTGREKRRQSSRARRQKRRDRERIRETEGVKKWRRPMGGARGRTGGAIGKPRGAGEDAIVVTEGKENGKVRAREES